MSKFGLRLSRPHAYTSSSTSLASLVPHQSQSQLQESSWPVQNRSYGKPSTKRLFGVVDSLAVLLSLLCLCVAVVVTTPRLRYAWQLNFAGQIIVIGAMLGLMNLCMHRPLLTLFVLIEATWGPSRLQNYDAILSSKIFASHISALWRVTIIAVTGLPLILSVAYKRFLGGTASVTLEPFNSSYGVDFPEVGLYAPKHSPIYLQITSYAPFLAASANATAPFPGDKLPMAFGYNTLLLNSTSSAIVDVPKPSYVKNIQSQLRGNESWVVSAEVQGYLATYDTNTSQLRADDDFWSQSLTSGQGGLTAFSLYQANHSNIGTIPFAFKASCWISVYLYGHDGWSTMTADPDNNDVVQFRKVAQFYNVRRRLFDAQWRIDATGITLLSGQLAADFRQSSVNQSLLYWENQMTPFPPDYMPDLPHVYWPYVDDSDSPWLQPSYATTIATVYWARAVYMLRSAQHDLYAYVPRVEQIVSTRSTIEAHPLLYIVYLVQPFISILSLGLIAFLYPSPVGNGFGTISILAGVEKSDLALLQGAGLSGKLTRPVTLEIVPRSFDDESLGEEVIEGAAIDTQSRISYRLGTTTRDTRPRYMPNKHTKYW